MITQNNMKHESTCFCYQSAPDYFLGPWIGCLILLGTDGSPMIDKNEDKTAVFQIIVKTHFEF